MTVGPLTFFFLPNSSNSSSHIELQVMLRIVMMYCWKYSRAVVEYLINKKHDCTVVHLLMYDNKNSKQYNIFPTNLQIPALTH